MSSQPLRQPTTRSRILVQMKYGSTPSFKRYTNWDSDYVADHDGNTYSSIAKMDVKIPTYTGGVREGEAVIGVPRDAFSDKVSDGYPHAPVYLTVWEEITSPVVPTEKQTLVLWRGTMTKGVRNPGGNPGRVNIHFKNMKAKLAVSMGLVCTSECPWVFGDVNTCDVQGNVNLASLIETGTLTTITGRTVVITGLSGVANGFWDQGYVELDDCRIKIRQWISGTTFTLTLEPRPDWVGQTVIVAPGCAKSKAACQVWSNEEQFGGIGIGTPSYHPLFERK